MSTTLIIGYILLYKPYNADRWYVHSHKIYGSVSEAESAAHKFLHPKTVVSVIELRDQDVQDGKFSI